MQAILDALAKIADPVMKSFRADLYEHDAKVILDLQPGDVILWTPRECGTHLVVLERAFRPNVRAKEHFDAVLSLGEPCRWHVVQVMHSGRWRLKQVSDARAYVETVNERAQRALYAQSPAPEVVREIHL